MMVGRGVDLQVKKAPAHPGEPVLEMRNLTVLDESGRVAVDRVNLEVRAGEIIAVAGVQGNGQTELAEAITGLALVIGGSICISRDETSPGRLPRRCCAPGSPTFPRTGSATASWGIS